MNRSNFSVDFRRYISIRCQFSLIVYNFGSKSRKLRRSYRFSHQMWTRRSERERERQRERERDRREEGKREERERERDGELENIWEVREVLNKRHLRLRLEERSINSYFFEKSEISFFLNDVCFFLFSFNFFLLKKKCLFSFNLIYILSSIKEKRKIPFLKCYHLTIFSPPPHQILSGTPLKPNRKRFVLRSFRIDFHSEFFPSEIAEWLYPPTVRRGKSKPEQGIILNKEPKTSPKGEGTCKGSTSKPSNQNFRRPGRAEKLTIAT